MKLVGITMKIVPHGHWSKKDENNRFVNRIRFIELLGEQLGYTCVEDWYKVKQKDAYDFGGAGLLVKYYSGSIQQLVQEAYPNYWFVPWLFGEAPNRYWESDDNIKLYLDWLANIKGYTTLNDLYKLRTEDFKKNNGMGLVQKFKNTFIDIYKRVYPGKEWCPFRFEITTMGSLKDEKTHRQYLKHLEEVLGISSPEQWYDKCSKANITENGCPGILAYYNRSAIQYIHSMYPEFAWKWYKFTQCSHGEWGKTEKVQEWFNDLLKHYNITDMENVYKLNQTDIINFYGNGGIDRYKTYINLIVENIDHPWDKIKFVKNGYSRKAVRFLDRLSEIIGTHIQHKLNNQNGEKKIGRVAVDGYISKEDAIKIPGLNSITGDVVIEYNGCCYHGCPKCYPNRLEKTWFSNKPYQYHYEYTEKRKNKLIASGLTVVDIWECDDTLLLDLSDWFIKKALEKTTS